MLGTMRNWGKWSEIDDVRLSVIIVGDIAFEKIFSVRVLELPVTLVGWNIWGRNKWKDRESRNSFVNEVFKEENSLILFG